MIWDKTDLIPEKEIKETVSEKTVDYAKRFGSFLGTDDYSEDNNGRRRLSASKLTSNQLRKFFGEVKRQQMQGYNKTDFVMLKPKLAYAVGRADKSSKIKDFYLVMSDAIDKVSDEKSFRNFISIFEAIVAYHKAAESGCLLDK